MKENRKNSCELGDKILMSLYANVLCIYYRSFQSSLRSILYNGKADERKTLIIRLYDMKSTGNLIWCKWIGPWHTMNLHSIISCSSLSFSYDVYEEMINKEDKNIADFLNENRANRKKKYSNFSYLYCTFSHYRHSRD